MNEDIYIIWKESFQKASNNATRNWQTTYAVLKLPEVIKHAKPFDENYRSTDIKKGNQTKNRYVELIKLRYTFNSQQLDYMNFTGSPEDAHGGKGTLVAMDLSESMRKIVEACFPRATRVIDRFHVQKLALEAVQEIRIKRRWSGEGQLRLFPNACRDHL